VRRAGPWGGSGRPGPAPATKGRVKGRLEPADAGGGRTAAADTIASMRLVTHDAGRGPRGAYRCDGAVVVASATLARPGTRLV
jgi:hypothetical protein